MIRIRERNELQWLAYWRDSPVSVFDFTDALREVLGLDPLKVGVLPKEERQK